MAYRFIAANNQGLLTTLPNLTTGITICAFYKHTTIPSSNNYLARQTIIARENSVTGNINYLFQAGSTRLEFTWTSATNVFHVFSIPLTPNTNWRGVAFSHTWGSNVNTIACVDGSRITLGTINTNAVQNMTLDIQAIGTRLNNLEHFNGDIANTAIWNTHLSEQELKALSNGFAPEMIRPQSLVFYAPLIRNLIDAKGGRTITNNNGATVAVHPRIYP